MRLLLFCNPNNIHNYNYIKNVLLKHEFDITVYSYSLPYSEIKRDYLDFYINNNVTIIGGYSISKEGHFKYFLKSFRSIDKLGCNYDCLHVQYLNPYISPIIYYYRKRFKRIVLTYWGSDLLRSNFLFRLMVKPLVGVSSWITFITSEMQTLFLKYYKIKDFQKYCLLDFGNMFFEIIDQKKLELLSGKVHKSIGLDNRLVTITIGYCWRKPMNQMQALHALFDNSQLPIEDIQIVLPTYGITLEAKQEMIDYLNGKNVRYRLFDTFMGPEDVSALRSVSDIFINPQTTDAFSSAMIEHLYAESIVINASWLKYSILDEKGVFYKNFRDFDELPSIIVESLKNLKEEKILAQKNKMVMYSFCSWSNWENKWLDLYN